MNSVQAVKRQSVALLVAFALAASSAMALPPPVVAPSAAPAAAIKPSNPATVSAVPEQDIRDIRGPISIPSPYRWLWLVAGVTAAIGLLYGAWRWYRSFAAAKAKLPFEIALDRLEKARALMKPEQAREYSFAVSEITRDYIEKRFSERAAHRTTDEFLRDLLAQTNSPLTAHRALLEDFLRYCDLAKFARWELDMPQMESMHESARNFILSTRPQPESPETHRSSKNGTAPHGQPVPEPFLQPTASL